jgi:hypothetical protein
VIPALLTRTDGTTEPVGRREDGGRRVGISEVDDARLDLRPAAAQIVADGFDGLAAVDEDDGAILGAELFGDRAADGAGRAGDDCGVHVGTLPRWDAPRRTSSPFAAPG